MAYMAFGTVWGSTCQKPWQPHHPFAWRGFWHNEPQTVPKTMPMEYMAFVMVLGSQCQKSWQPHYPFLWHCFWHGEPQTVPIEYMPFVMGFVTVLGSLCQKLWQSHHPFPWHSFWYCEPQTMTKTVPMEYMAFVMIFGKDWGPLCQKLWQPHHHPLCVKISLHLIVNIWQLSQNYKVSQNEGFVWSGEKVLYRETPPLITNPSFPNSLPFHPISLGFQRILVISLDHRLLPLFVQSLPGQIGGIQCPLPPGEPPTLAYYNSPATRVGSFLLSFFVFIWLQFGKMDANWVLWV